MPIVALNNETVKLLKSTQVVSNIWSVIKELIENALDANAKNIEVYLNDNGLSMIKVRDDGIGICKEDAAFIGLASYTSKISNFQDLENLNTYGFRGVALNSICTLANVTISTKTEKEQVATVYKFNHNGEVEKTDYMHGNTGTTIEVKDFCKNFPVRRKLLSDTKLIRKDLKNVEILIKDFSICNPEVRFMLQINNTIVFTKPYAKDTMQSLSYVIGYKNTLNLHRINQKISDTEIELIVPKKDVVDCPDLFKSGQEFIFINKRPIQHKEIEQILLKKTIEYFTSKQLNVKKSLFLLNMSINPAEIDVNLEPNKNKILIQNKEHILKTIDEIISKYYELEFTMNNVEEDENKRNKNCMEINDESIINNESVSCTSKISIGENIDQDHMNNETNEKKTEHNKKPIQHFKHLIRPPILSESDSDGEITIKSKTSCMETIDEKSKLKSENVSTNQMDTEEETLSQLPVVNLGEDFDLSDLQNDRMSKNNRSNNVSEASAISNIDYGSDSWSRGHIPGGGGIDVVVPVNLNTHNDNVHFSKHKSASKSGFGIFFSEIRTQMLKEKPNAKETEIAKDITKQWNDLSSEERGYYRDLCLEQMNSSLTPKTQKTQKRRLEDGDPENNKKKFIKFLENMKRDNKNDQSKKNLVKKTIIPWKITLNDVCINFRKSLEKKETSNNNVEIIGHASNKQYWFVKYNASNWLLNVPRLLKDSSESTICIEQVNAGILKRLLQLKLLKNSNIDNNTMYHIHEI